MKTSEPLRAAELRSITMSQVNGKLSSRVMNMKFMRFAKKEDEDVPTVEEIKTPQIRDNSQWSFKDNKSSTKTSSVKLRRPQKAKAKVIRNDVSITELKRDINPIIRGRRVRGSDKTEENLKRERSDKEDEDDDYDLDKIFKQMKNDKGGNK